MCIYAVKKQKLKKKHSRRGMCNSTERPKIRRLRCEDTAKTKKIEVTLEEHSVFFHWKLSL